MRGRVAPCLELGVSAQDGFFKIFSHLRFREKLLDAFTHAEDDFGVNEVELHFSPADFIPNIVRFNESVEGSGRDGEPVRDGHARAA